jgi:hypothetical protein
MQMFLQQYEAILVKTMKTRLVRAVLYGPDDFSSCISDEALKTHAQSLELHTKTLRDVIGYDLFEASKTISASCTRLPNADYPSLAEILYGQCQTGPVHVQKATTCFLSWHMASKLMDIVDALGGDSQQPLCSDGGGPGHDGCLFFWNNLFAIRQVARLL